jgi:hypothetical protein
LLLEDVGYVHLVAPEAESRSDHCGPGTLQADDLVVIIRFKMIGLTPITMSIDGIPEGCQYIIVCRCIQGYRTMRYTAVRKQLLCNVLMLASVLTKKTVAAMWTLLACVMMTEKEV